MNLITKSLFIFTIFSLPLLTFEWWLVRPLVVPAQMLWIFSPLLGISCLISEFDSIKKNGDKAIKSNSYLILISIFFLYEIIRELTASPPLKALFGDIRGAFLSISTSFSFLVLFLASQRFSHNKKMRLYLLIAMSLSVSLVSFFALLQIYGYFGTTPMSGRGSATLPNPLELAGTALLLLLPAIVVHETKETFTQNANSELWLKRLFLFVIVMLSVAIIVSGSKIAIFIASILFAIYISKLFIDRDFNKSALIVVSLIFLIMTFFAFKSTVSVYSNERLSDVGASVSNRTGIWKNAFAMWGAKPVFGWGQADYPNLNKLFVMQAKTGVDKEALTVFDAHNFVLDVLSKGGIVKLALILAVALFLVKKLIAGKLNDSLSVAFIFGAGIYLIFLFFGVSYIVSKVYFVVILGLIGIRGSSNSRFLSKLDNKLLRTVMIIGLAVVFIIQSYFGVKRVRAEIIASNALKYIEKNQLGEGIRLSKKAIELSPVEADYFARTAFAYLWRYRVSGNDADLQDAKEYYMEGLKLSPNDVLMQDKLIKIDAKINNPDMQIEF